MLLKDETREKNDKSQYFTKQHLMVFPILARGEYYSSRSHQSDSIARTASLQPVDVRIQ